MSTTLHDNILFYSFHSSFVISHFKCSSSLQQDEFWLAINVFIVHQLKFCWSDSNNIVPLYCYHYSCNVDSVVLLKSELFFTIVIILGVNVTLYSFFLFMLEQVRLLFKQGTSKFFVVVNSIFPHMRSIGLNF